MDMIEKKVVFTNGCFDILHFGHLHYLEKCAQLGDYLIIGLNSDESIAKLKGDNRPINSALFRKKLLSSLRYIDEVIIFNEDTPIKLIKDLKPDVLAKGGDYNPIDIVGYDFVKSYGGRVITLEFLEGFSTTGTIEKIRG